MLSWMAQQPTPAMLDQAVALGFQGIHVDRWGYADAGKAIEAELRRDLHVEPILSQNQRDAFYSLQGRVAGLRRLYPTQEEWQRWQDSRRFQTVYFWGSGFYEEESTPKTRWRPAYAHAELGLVNPLPEEQTVTLRFRARTYQPGEATLRLSGKVIKTAIPIGQTPMELVRSIRVPPGTHTLRFDCDAKVQTEGQRKLVFALHDVEIVNEGQEQPVPVVRQGPLK
jgi:hypothetical protein